MSTWSKSINTIEKDFSHFPNPFPFIKNWRVISCGPDVTLIIQMWGAFLGSFVWSQFFPTPKQLIKHGIHGDYACGIELDAGDSEAADIIWSDSNFAEVALEIAGPLQEAVIAVWAVSALFEGLDLAHSLYMAVETCPGDPNECKLGDGSSFFPSAEETGAAVLYTSLWDPTHAGDPTPGDIRYPTGNVTFEAFGYLTNVGADISLAEVFFSGAGQFDNKHTIAPPPIGGRTAFHLYTNFHASSSGAISVALHIKQTSAGAFTTNFICTRFIAHFGPDAPDPRTQYSPHAPRSCSAPNQPPLNPTQPI